MPSFFLLTLRALLALSFCSVALFSAQAEGTPASGAPPASPSAAAPALGSGDFLSGRFARQQGDDKGAIEYLERLVNQESEGGPLASQVLVLALEQQDMPRAVAAAKRLQKKEGHEPIVELTLAIDAIQHADYAAARILLEKAYGSKERSVWLPLFHAWLSYGEGVISEPLKLDALVIDKKTAVPAFLAYQVGLANDAAGFMDAAETAYKQATQDMNTAPFRAVEAAVNFYRRQQRMEEGTKLRKLYMKTHAEEEQALAGLSDVAVLDALLDPAATARAQRVAGTAQEGVAEMLFTMASLLYAVDPGRDVQVYLRLALHLRPDFPVAQLLLGGLLEDQQRFAEAAKMYGSISHGSPLYPRALIRRVYSTERHTGLKSALALLDKSAGTPGTDPASLEVVRGDLLRMGSRFLEAAEAYTRALEHLPPQAAPWGIYFARGTCFERSGNWEQAEADLRQALALSPDNAEVLNYLGYSLLVRDKDLAQARSFIEQAYALQPDAPHIIDSMGWALFKTGDAESAATLLEQAIELTPSDASVNDHLGDAYWQVGRKNEARFQWERALSFKPDAALEESLRHKLEGGMPEVTPAAAAPEPSSAQEE